MAFIGALIGVKLDDYLHKKDLHDCACHHHEHDKEDQPHQVKASFWNEKLKPMVKKYTLPLFFAIAVWGLHFLFFRHHH